MVESDSGQQGYSRRYLLHFLFRAWSGAGISGGYFYKELFIVQSVDGEGAGLIMKENNYKPQIPDVMEAVFDAAYLIFDLVAAGLFLYFHREICYLSFMEY